MHVCTASRGNIISITGKSDNVTRAKTALENLYRTLEKGREISMIDVDAAIKMAHKPTTKHPAVSLQEYVVTTRKKNIVPYTHIQLEYLKTLQQKELVFAAGPAGTGKTYIAVAMAVSMFLNKQVERIILSRPAVEAGEKLGFLPGDLKEKIDPYLRPLYDALHDMLPAEQINKFMETNEIEIAPLAFMRGRTLNHAFIILDEAQNTTATQMKMFLTRLGEGSRVVVTGDLSQVDLPPHTKSGLSDALVKLRQIKEIGFIHFSDRDIIRHPLTAKIVKAYERHERTQTEEPSS